MAVDYCSERPVRRGSTSKGGRNGSNLEAVIPGRCEASNPESRDSGSGPSDHPGMTKRLQVAPLPLDRLMTDGFDPVAVGITQKRRIIRSVIVAQTPCTVVAAAGS